MGRNHPVHGALIDAAYQGRELTPDELDNLKLDPDDRRRVAALAREAAQIHATGERAKAWEHVLEHGAELLDTLPAAQQDPAYLQARDPLADVTDPVELAARIPRF